MECTFCTESWISKCIRSKGDQIFQLFEIGKIELFKYTSTRSKHEPVYCSTEPTQIARQTQLKNLLVELKLDVTGFNSSWTQPEPEFFSLIEPEQSFKLSQPVRVAHLSKTAYPTWLSVLVLWYVIEIYFFCFLFFSSTKRRILLKMKRERGGSPKEGDVISNYKWESQKSNTRETIVCFSSTSN